MSSEKRFFRCDEDLVLGLKRLYETYGYKKFKMGKFEKYDLYLENKSFLKNGSIITVTDPKGRLLALKPDITLSIVKNVRSISLPEKVYYNENVYISDSDAGEIKETTQIGLEYIGDLDVRALSEILILAAESLSFADENYRIAISHMGFISDILDQIDIPEFEKNSITKFISDKNLHGIKDICIKYGIDSSVSEKLCGLILVCGNFKEFVLKSKELVSGDASSRSFEELNQISSIISSFGYDEKFILDFSVMNDMNYYNGLVFQGFIQGIPKSVLSGGRYDNLVKRLGRDTSAVGFAVYTERLAPLNDWNDEYDCDVFIQYSKDCNPSDVLKAQREFSQNGIRCLALENEIEGMKFVRKVVVLPDGSMKNE